MRRIAWVGIPLLILFGLFEFYVSPDTIARGFAISPDHQAIVKVDEKVYESFGPLIYVVRIGPDNAFLNMIFGQKLIEIDEDSSNSSVPYADWRDSKTVVIALPVKQDKLAATIRDGLYPHPAADHYGSVRIIYQAQ